MSVCYPFLYPFHGSGNNIQRLCLILRCLPVDVVIHFTKSSIPVAVRETSQYFLRIEMISLYSKYERHLGSFATAKLQTISRLISEIITLAGKSLDGVC